jgi:hypothetical protein
VSKECVGNTARRKCWKRPKLCRRRQKRGKEKGESENIGGSRVPNRAKLSSKNAEFNFLSNGGRRSALGVSSVEENAKNEKMLKLFCTKTWKIFNKLIFFFTKPSSQAKRHNTFREPFSLHLFAGKISGMKFVEKVKKRPVLR